MTTPRSLALAAAVLVGILPAQGKVKTPKQPEFEKVATLGVETRAPTKEECVRHALDLDVRYQGQMIERVATDGAGARAGLKVGDVILMFDKVEVFSRDDIRDLLMVRKPGQEVTLQVMRGKAKAGQRKEILRLGLGEHKIPKQKGSRMTWHHAGLPYLKEALAQAKKEGKRVLVGLSGAET